MKDNTTSDPILKYGMSAFWSNANKKPQLAQKLNIVLRNNTDSQIFPKISFDAKEIKHSDIRVMQNQYYKQETTQGIITGTMVGPLMPHSIVILEFICHFLNPTNNPPLPKNFTFDNKPLEIPQGLKPPTAVAEVKKVASGTDFIELKWSESNDPFGIAKYKIVYNPIDQPTIKLYDNTFEPEHKIEELKPGTPYKVEVVAYNFADLESIPSDPVILATDIPLIGDSEH